MAYEKRTRPRAQATAVVGSPRPRPIFVSGRALQSPVKTWLILPVQLQSGALVSGRPETHSCKVWLTFRYRRRRQPICRCVSRTSDCCRDTSPGGDRMAERPARGAASALVPRHRRAGVGVTATQRQWLTNLSATALFFPRERCDDLDHQRYITASYQPAKVVRLPRTS